MAIITRGASPKAVRIVAGSIPGGGIPTDQTGSRRQRRQSPVEPLVQPQYLGDLLADAQTGLRESSVPGRPCRSVAAHPPHLFSGMRSRSWPSKRISPPTMRPGRD